MNAVKRFLQSLTANPEVMQEIADIDAQFSRIEACGTSREDALRMALRCAQIGLTPDDIEPMARNWVTNPPRARWQGLLDPGDIPEHDPAIMFDGDDSLTFNPKDRRMST